MWYEYVVDWLDTWELLVGQIVKWVGWDQLNLGSLLNWSQTRSNLLDFCYPWLTSKLCNTGISLFKIGPVIISVTCYYVHYGVTMKSNDKRDWLSS